MRAALLFDCDKPTGFLLKIARVAPEAVCFLESKLTIGSVTFSSPIR